MSSTAIATVVKMLESLPEAPQERVVERLREYITVMEVQPSKKIPRGTPGRDLLRFVGSIPAESVEQMRQAIEEDCEQIDKDEW